MSSLIYKIFKPITIEHIKNNELIAKIQKKIENEINAAQKLFKKVSIKEKQRQISSQTKNKELSTSNIPLNKNLSEKYYNDIVKIFNKYSSVSTCETTIENNDKYKKCENDKINYYKMLITLLNYNLINEVENYLYFEDTVTKEIHTTNPIYINKITKYINEHTKILKDKIKTHCERSGKENCNNKQNGGKKTTIKKPTKKTTTKKPIKKSKK